MPTIEIAFLSAALVAVVTRGIRWRRPSHIADAMAFVAVLLGVAHASVQGPRVLLVPVYAIALLLCGMAIARIVRPRSRDNVAQGKRSRVRTVLRVAATTLGVIVVALNAAVERIMTPLSNHPQEIFESSTKADFAAQGWESAFRAANRHLARDYAFGEWKRIAWDSLERAYAPRIAQAERTKNRAAYYTAMRDYLWSIPDGHVGLAGPDSGLREAAIGAGFGLAVLTLDDGRTIVNVVTRDAEAARAGMKWGAEILSWNGVRTADALRAVPLTWAGSPPATEEGVRIVQQKLLPRAADGARVTVEFRNPDDSTTRSAELVAHKDRYAAYRHAWPATSITPSMRPVSWRLTPDGFGYVRILLEFPLLGGLLPDRDVRQAVSEFVARRVPGVIIDIRANGGGADKLVTEMVGYFFDHPVFYERAAFFDSTARRFVADPSSTLRIEPKTPRYMGPIVAIIDNDCASSCEGVAWAVRERGGQVVGWWGTYGSFGMSGAEVNMPAGLTIEYPNGQSVDSVGRVQLDSDTSHRGGVEPTIRVPRTLETVRRQWVDRADVALEMAKQQLRAEAAKAPNHK